LKRRKPASGLLCVQYGLSPAIIGLVFLASPASYAIASPMWGWIVDKLVGRRVVAAVYYTELLIYWYG